jgi:hypothetical protein
MTFDYTSRYYSSESATHTLPDGRTVTYKRRRFSPPADSLPTLAETAVQQGERLDHVTHRTLGDPLQFWRVADANSALNPFDLVDPEGQTLRIPVPQP